MGDLTSRTGSVPVQDTRIDIARLRQEYGNAPDAADRFLFDYAHAMVRRTQQHAEAYGERVAALAIAVDRCSPARYPALRERLQARAHEADAALVLLREWVAVAEQCARRLGVVVDAATGGVRIESLRRPERDE